MECLIKGKILLLILLLIGGGCKKVDDLGFRIYTIKEGRHKSTHTYSTTKNKYTQFEARFDSSVIYTTINPDNQLDINKLYGVSDCGCDHRTHSMRFGWRWYNNQIEIFWFRHQNGSFDYGKITNVGINESNTYTLSRLEDEYIMCVADTCVTLIRPCEEEYKSYYLYPYFGGDERAPHDITIKLKKI